MSKPKLTEDMKGKMIRLMEQMAYYPTQNEEFNDDNVTSDVKNMSNLVSPAQKTAAKKINTQREFNEAFEVWFGSLGFDEDYKKNRINITTSIENIRSVMEKYGIKY